jgi:hypothetical protein
MTIFLIAIGVFLVAVATWFIRVFADGRKQRRRVEAFQQDIARQERTFKPDDDSTKTWPVIDWEKRYAELVEITAARTDQAKEKDDKLPEGC